MPEENRTESKPMKAFRPTTLHDAVDILMREVPEDSKRAIQTMRKEDLASLHMGFGSWVRNAFGLWGDNKQLLEAIGCWHEPMRLENANGEIEVLSFIDGDGASGILIDAFLRRLRPELFVLNLMNCPEVKIFVDRSHNPKERHESSNKLD